MEMPYPNHLRLSNITNIIIHLVILTNTIVFPMIFYLAAQSQSPNQIEGLLNVVIARQGYHLITSKIIMVVIFRVIS